MTCQNPSPNHNYCVNRINTMNGINKGIRRSILPLQANLCNIGFFLCVFKSITYYVSLKKCYNIHQNENGNYDFIFTLDAPDIT
mmetsp:Transcript_63506/g.74365  ORF Transcript_63506/g.74365 Transcript_63506/m.74365 type:complete len:84 (-) Transcript_63506:87-338(-)